MAVEYVLDVLPLGSLPGSPGSPVFLHHPCSDCQTATRQKVSHGLRATGLLDGEAVPAVLPIMLLLRWFSRKIFEKKMMIR
jgi:hypothetical protein